MAKNATTQFELATTLTNKYYQLCEQAGSNEIALKNSIEQGQKAIEAYRNVLELNMSCFQAWISLWELQFSLGQIDQSLDTIRRYMQLQHSIAQKSGLADANIRFVAPSCAGSIGVISMLEAHIKAKLLGMQPNCQTLLFVKPNVHISNWAFLNYWRKYVTLVEDPKSIQALEPAAAHLTDWVNWVVPLDGQEQFYTGASAIVRKRWEEENRPPLLSLEDSHRENGWRILNGLGMPLDAWFTCLHVRESGFKNDLAVDSYRNAEIETYYPMIEAITRAGGWVVRVGDPSMKPLRPMPNVIDYVHTQFYADWMDVFLCASCRFFISTSSGLCGVSYSFGIPVVQTNFVPLSAISTGSRDIFIPKMFRSKHDGRMLSFKEILSPPISTSYWQYRYTALNVETIDNTPEEISDLVLEMNARMENHISYTPQDEELQERFRKLSEECGTCMGFGINSRIGQSFLRKYSHLL